MRSNPRVTALLLGWLTVGYGSLTVAGDRQDVETSPQVSIATIVSEVRDALIRAQKQLAGRQGKLPPLSSVSLTLRSIATRESNGKVKLWVVTAGKNRKTEHTQELTVELAPPSVKAPLKAGPTNIAASLEKLIVAAVEGTAATDQGEIPLSLTGLDIVLEFVVLSKGQAGAALEIVPVSFGIGGEVSDQSVQKLHVQFRAQKQD